MRRTLMVLGAGFGQLPALEKAKKRGYRVIATSCYADDIGMSVADIPLPIDTTDIKSTLRAAQEYKIDGILTMATDVAIPTLGKIVDELNLIGPSFQSALLSTDKTLMKKRLQQYNVPTARFKIVRTLSEARDAIDELRLPVMLKVVDSSGSRGITRIDETTKLEEAFQTGKAISRSNVFLVEEYMEGLEFGAQGLVYKGELRFVFVHNDTVTSPPYPTPIGHSYPMELTANAYNRIFEIVATGVEALEIDNSMLNVDLIMTPSGPKIIEIGARMGATCLPELTTIYSGIDVVDVAIDIAMGEEPNLREREKKQPCAGLLIRSTRTGTLEFFAVPHELSSDPRVVAIRWDKKIGDQVRKFRAGPDRIGEIVVTSDNYRDAEELCTEIEKRLILRVN